MEGDALNTSSEMKARLGARLSVVASGTQAEGALATARGSRGLQRREKRRKLLRVVFVVLQASIAGAALLFNEGNFFRRSRSHNVHRHRRDFTVVTSSLTDGEFRKTFRMGRASFAKLAEMVRVGVTRDHAMAILSSSGPVTAEVCLGVTLLVLSGMSYRSAFLIFGIARSTVYDVFHRTLEVVAGVLSLDGIPTTYGSLQHLAMRFTQSRSPPNPLNGCIGAIDGIAIKIKNPDDDLNPAQFYCRKNFYALPLQAVADSDYRFTYCSLKCVSSTHDSLSYSVSDLSTFLRNGGLPRGFWIAADDAYECTETLITPVPRRRAPIWSLEDSFNFYHSSLRMHVEQAFGILVARWGILWTPLRFDLHRATRVVDVALRLYNYCIE